MPKNDIGGFFVSLGLNIDRDSFETGNKLIDGVGNSFNKLIGSARNAAVVLAGTAVATGSVESAAYKMSEKLNISTESLDLWKATAKIAGVDANGLISVMGRMANVLDHMKVDGTGLQEFTKQLGKLGIVTDDIDIEKMLNMAPDELMTEILRKAQEASAKAKKDIAEAKKALELNPNDTEAQTKLTEAQDVQRQVLTIVRDNLGDEGQGLFIELERQGKTIDELHSLAKQTIFTDKNTNADANNFMEQVRVTKTLSENITKLLGSDIAKGLTPVLTELNTWLLGHGDDIKNAMSSLAGAIEKVIGKTVDFVTDEETLEKVKTGAKVVKDTVTKTAEGTGKIVHGVVNGDAKEIGEGVKQAATGAIVEPVKAVTKAASETEWAQEAHDKISAEKAIRDYKATKGYTGVKSILSIPYSELTPELQKDFDKYAEKGLIDKRLHFAGAIKDGIMRPDGTVTQVAPDDWVLAARNLGDLAKAFVPEEKERPVTESIKETKLQIIEQQPQVATEVNIAAPPESEAPRIVPKDETPINNFVSQQPQPQVATDNWSIVAKTINDLARSFIQPQPQTVQQSAGEYTINQTFNISGGNDMPQIIRQQAYRGTQDGLLEIMQQSSQRLQLMSGTR